jgi:hypothetical protein
MLSSKNMLRHEEFEGALRALKPNSIAPPASQGRIVEMHNRHFIRFGPRADQSLLHAQLDWSCHRQVTGLSCCPREIDMVSYLL